MDGLDDALYALATRVSGEVDASLAGALWEVSVALRDRPLILPPGSHFLFLADDGKWKRGADAIALRTVRGDADEVEVLTDSGVWADLDSERRLLRLGGKP